MNKIEVDTPLSKREKLFVEEYLVDLNGTRAAIRAGYTESSARSQASDLLAKPNIADAVATAISARSKRTRMKQDRVIRELERLAFTDIRDVLSWGTRTVTSLIDGTESETHGIWLKDSENLSAKTSAAIKEISEVRGKADVLTTSVKMHDKIRALELLDKHLGMFAQDKNEEEENHGGKTLKLIYSNHDPEGRK